MKSLPNITSLRFFLAFLVMLFHIPQFFQNRGLPFYNDLPIFNKGSEAVYMFFSLSGFLIIRQLFQEKSTTGSIRLQDFYMRRILRIFPLYYLVAAVGLIYYNFILPKFGFPPENNYNFWKGFLLLFSFFSNVFSTYNPGGTLEILWSIGVEEQFYLLIAPTILVIPVKYVKSFLFIVSLLFISLYHNSLFDFFSKYRMLFFYFSFAGFCSLLNFHETKIYNFFKIFSFILVLLYFTTNLFVSFFSDFLYQLLGMILFGFFLNFFTKKPINLFENKKLIGLGKVSYGIYMYHPIVMQFVGYALLKCNSFFYSLTIIILSYSLTIIITILVAKVSYKYYEKKFINLKKKFRTISFS